MRKILFFIKGKVIKGKQRGKILGFPTANIKLSQNIAEGIYISKVKINKETFNAITFIGAAKTFNDVDIKAESYILDFNRDIYGIEIEISLLKKIRENEKFISEAKLIEAMNSDLKIAKEYFIGY